MNCAALLSGNILCSPWQSESMLAFSTESRRAWSFFFFLSSFSPDMKSMYILYSGRELAISLPSEERMFPRLVGSGLLSLTKRSATSCQYSCSANMMMPALTMMAMPTSVRKSTTNE